MASEDPQRSATIHPRFPGPHRVHGLLHASDHQVLDRPPEWGGVRHAEQAQDGTNAPGEPVYLRERPGLPGNRGRDAERHLDGQPPCAEENRKIPCFVGEGNPADRTGESIPLPSTRCGGGATGTQRAGVKPAPTVEGKWSKTGSETSSPSTTWSSSARGSPA